MPALTIWWFSHLGTRRLASLADARLILRTDPVLVLISLHQVGHSIRGLCDPVAVCAHPASGGGVAFLHDVACDWAASVRDGRGPGDGHCCSGNRGDGWGSWGFWDIYNFL